MRRSADRAHGRHGPRSPHGCDDAKHECRLTGAGEVLRLASRCPSRAPGGVLPRPESASSYHGRPPAIHGRLGTHPPVRATGTDLLRLRHGQQRARNRSCPCLTPHGNQPRPSRSGQLPRLTHRRRLSSRRDDRSGPAVDAGGCPEPAMDGRRPDVGAGRGDIRLGIPLWPRWATPGSPWASVSPNADLFRARDHARPLPHPRRRTDAAIPSTRLR